MSIGSVVFAQRTVECLITLQWTATFSDNNNCPLSLGDRVLYLTMVPIGPTQVINPNGTLIDSAVFVWVQCICFAVQCIVNGKENPPKLPLS